jgi:hypothetical protein
VPPPPPRAAAICLYRREGLWTYELCYKKHIRQFRTVGKLRPPALWACPRRREPARPAGRAAPRPGGGVRVPAHLRVLGVPARWGRPP